MHFVNGNQRLKLTAASYRFEVKVKHTIYGYFLQLDEFFLPQRYQGLLRFFQVNFRLSFLKDLNRLGKAFSGLVVSPL